MVAANWVRLSRRISHGILRAHFAHTQLLQTCLILEVRVARIRNRLPGLSVSCSRCRFPASSLPDYSVTRTKAGNIRREMLRLRCAAPLRISAAGSASLTPAKRLKLSPSGPIVLHAKVCGRVGRCRHKSRPGSEMKWPFPLWVRDFSQRTLRISPEAPSRLWAALSRLLVASGEAPRGRRYCRRKCGGSAARRWPFPFSVRATLRHLSRPCRTSWINLVLNRLYSTGRGL